MADVLVPLSMDQIALLSDDEQAEYLEHLEALHRSRAKSSFLHFCQSVEVPGAPMEEPEPDVYYPKLLTPAKHHRLVIDAVQKMADGEYHDVDGIIAQAPPGSAKSSYLSVLAPAWLLGRKPGTNVIAASYGQDLANRFGRRVRTISRSDRYQQIMGCTITGDNQAVDNWSLTNGSDYRAVGMGAAVTGFRADCLVGDTIVETLDGPRRIDDICARPEGCKVLSYEGSLRRPVYRRVLAVARRRTDELWRIRTASGRVVETTGNHRFYAGGAWTQASSLAVGDVLLRAVQCAGSEGVIRGGEEGPALLRQAVLHKNDEPSPRSAGQVLHKLRESTGDERDAVLLGRVPERDSKEEGISAPSSRTREIVHGVRCDVPAAQQRNSWYVLLHALQERWAFGPDWWGSEPQLAAWPRSEPLPRGQWAQVQGSPTRGIEARQMLRDVWGWLKPAGASHRWGQHEQRRDERRHPVRDVPHEAARGGAPETAPDNVAMVERVRRECFVYDIQVEETESFFANGVLVHNCLLIDDPLKGREEADSEVIRNKVYAGMIDDLFTRLKPGGKIFAALTRWHEDDPIGRLLGSEWKGQSGLWRGTDGRLWLIINLPMIAEHPDDPLGRKPGEMLWPEWYRENEVERLRKSAEKGGTVARTWSSLYQQRPAPSEGVILRREDWKRWKDVKKLKDGSEVPDPPECDFVVLSYDTAFEEDEEADYSAMTAWGIFPSTSTKKTGEQFHHHHAIMLGAWRDKVSAIDLADLIQEHYRHFKPDLILIEKRASGITVLQELKRLRLPVKAWLPKGKPGAKGKIPRAHGIAMILEQGCVHYVPGPKTEAVIAECASFPYATNDDWVDSVTSCLLFFRDRFMFRSADEEMDGEERIAHLAEKAEQRRMGRKLYGANEPRIRARNERHLYGSKTVKDDVDPYDKRLVDDTRRKIYGA
jgi:phage terminase large subunit-like protein